jgi:uncharacterized membrane protein YozB (DUF420 family)
MAINAAIQAFFGIQLTFNTHSTIKSFNPTMTSFSQLEINQSIFFGTSLLLSVALLIYAIRLTLKENKQGVTLGIIVSCYTFSLGFFGLFLMNTSQFIWFDSIRGGIAAFTGYLFLNAQNKKTANA